MSASYQRDSNYRVTGIRKGLAIGGNFDPGTLTADTWYRLMPSDDGGAKAASTVEHSERTLNIGTVRADVVNAILTDWVLKILNVGYQREFEVESHDAATATSVHLRLISAVQTVVDFKNLPAAIEWVMYPPLLNPIVVNVSGAQNVEFGYIQKVIDDYTISRVDSLGVVEPGKSLVFPYSDLDKLVFKYATLDTTSRLAWGEHYIV